MDRHRSYSTKTAEEQGIAPSFDIDGMDFSCITAAPGSVLLDLVADMADQDSAVKLRAILRFFKVIMEPEEHARFRKYVDDPATRVEATLLVSIANDLLTEYSARPTMRPSGSAPGPSPTGATSTGSSPSEASSPPESLSGDSAT